MTFEPKRKPRTLSYSALTQWEKNPEEFFLRRIAEHRVAGTPQDKYGAVGSTFDAYVKSRLHEALFGIGADPQFEFQTLFESQVETHNRDMAQPAGLHVFGCYIESGAYQELLDLLMKADAPPRFEFNAAATIEGVPITGKPDLRFPVCGVDVTLDWKVNGYFSKSGQSPSKGYAMCRDGFKSEKPTRGNGTSHNGYLAMDFKGLPINTSYLEACSPHYADQLSTYGWLMGATVGDENTVCAIDEMVGRPGGEFPRIRVAQHRARVSRDHQLALIGRYQRCWNAINSGHLFADLPRDDSDARCVELEETALGLQSAGSDDDWFSQVTREQQFRR